MEAWVVVFLVWLFLSVVVTVMLSRALMLGKKAEGEIVRVDLGPRRCPHCGERLNAMEPMATEWSCPWCGKEWLSLDGVTLNEKYKRVSGA